MNKTTEYIHRRETATSEATLSATLTSMFGAKASPKAARYAAASVRKGIHLYSEEDILRSSGTERERRKWWNEKSKTVMRGSTVRHVSGRSD